MQMELIETLLASSTLFVSIGTSGTVYPAAGFLQMAQVYGAKTVELNLEPSESASRFDDARYGPASQIVPDFFAELSEQN